LISLFASCQKGNQDSDLLESALTEAGDNRTELNHLQEWCELLGGKSAPRLKSGGEDDFWNPYGNGTTANNGVCEGMVGADIGGAVTGTIIGTAAGPGIVASTVVTGVGASAGQVAVNIWNHWF
jgi:hypothetical protein